MCTGCSTGCNVDVYHNKEGVWRVKPRHSEVNGHWMCDEGRDIYQATNLFRTEHVGERGSKKTVKRPNRVTQTLAWQDGKRHYLNTNDTVKSTGTTFGGIKDKNAALVLTGQYTNEELEGLLSFWKKSFSKVRLFHWKNSGDSWNDFDGLLIRGDKNPNSKGLMDLVEKHGGFEDWSKLEGELKAGSLDFLMVAGPENQWVYPELSKTLDLFSGAKEWIYLSACIPGEVTAFEKSQAMVWPMKTFAEKSGTFTNFEGKVQNFDAIGNWSKEAMDMREMVQLMSGDERSLPSKAWNRVKNEFIHKRGTL